MRSNEKTASQTVNALLSIRELILKAKLGPGERTSELALVERLGMSRTPIRMALVRLEEEGLLEALPGGGFVVKTFNDRDIRTAIEIRGTLEGLAARMAAERGLSELALAKLQRCLDALDAVVAAGVSKRNFSDYVKLNEQFHAQILSLADSPVLDRQLARVVSLPFASAGAFLMAQASLPQAATMFTVAQDQHRCILQAIGAGESARAEALMREHARVASRNLDLALLDQHARRLVPGSHLIRLTDTTLAVPEGPSPPAA